MLNVTTCCRMLNIDTIFQIKFYVKHHYSQTKLIPHPPDYSVSALNEGRHHTHKSRETPGARKNSTNDI